MRLPSISPCHPQIVGSIANGTTNAFGTVKNATTGAFDTVKNATLTTADQVLKTNLSGTAANDAAGFATSMAITALPVLAAAQLLL